MMINRVELIYNPYRESSRMLINGASVSEYSQLANYLREPFERWSTMILEYIEQEINDDFELEITSSALYCTILREIAQTCDACTALSAKEFLLNEDVEERLLKLRALEAKNGENKKTGETIRVLFEVADAVIADSLFGGICKEGSYKIIDHVLLNEEQQVTIEICTDIRMAKERQYDLIVGIGKRDGDCKQIFLELSQNQIESQKGTGIIISEEQKFVGIENGIYKFEADALSVVELAKALIGNLAIAPYIKRSKEKWESSFWEDTDASQKDRMDFKLIDAVDPVIMVCCRNEVEEGQSTGVKVTVIPETNVAPELEVKIGNSQILKYENGKIYGLQDGETDVEIAIKGSIEPIFRQRIRVKRVIKVSEIHISESSILLKSGRTCELNYEYEPKDADNIDEILWESSDCRVAVVDSKGCIKGVAPGECVITVSIGNVSGQCRLVVRPEMKQIVVPQQQVILTMGKRMRFIPVCEPVNCYDTTILYDVENTNVIKYDGKNLISNGLGDTMICFHDRDNKIQTSVAVKVESTLYASEKANTPKLLSFIMAIISLFLLSFSKWFCVAGAITGGLLGIAAIFVDQNNVKGMLNVNGNPMKADCFVSTLFLMINLLIGVLVSLWV